MPAQQKYEESTLAPEDVLLAKLPTLMLRRPLSPATSCSNVERTVEAPAGDFKLEGRVRGGVRGPRDERVVGSADGKKDLKRSLPELDTSSDTIHLRPPTVAGAARRSRSASPGSPSSLRSATLPSPPPSTPTAALPIMLPEPFARKPSRFGTALPRSPPRDQGSSPSLLSAFERFRVSQPRRGWSGDDDGPASLVSSASDRGRQIEVGGSR